MASLSLPAPTRSIGPSPSSLQKPKTPSMPSSTSPKKKTLNAPSYESRCSSASAASKLTPEERRSRKIKLFVPRALTDFDDGGAFPEIHVAQYPRHMGNPHMQQKKKAIVNVEVDSTGEVSYDAIVKGGTNSDKIVYSRHQDLRGGDPQDVSLPTTQEEEEAKQKTQAALDSLLQNKIAMDKPTGSAMVQAETSKDMEAKTKFIKYTPREDAPGYNPSAKQRVIQMVPKQVDPMMPPKHKHIKAPRGPAEDVVPVLHAPPTKLSKEEREAWNVPACISNWKNTRGYTIPLDKRLAADGRHLREHTINANFATLSESLYVAERQARQEVRARAQVQKKMALQEKQQQEEELRDLANQARRDRSNQNNNTVATLEPVPAAGAISDHEEEQDHHHNESEEEVAARQRERLRQERKREREREMRMENNVELKKQRLESERDVSEKVALGVHTGSGGGNQVDSRLYNQSAGLDSGFGAEDEYNTYTKPLFGAAAAGSSSIYRPTRGDTQLNADEQYDKLLKGSTSKFQPDKGFAGADGGGDNVVAEPRTAPVQFERERKN